MPSELTSPTPNWTALRGQVLEGGYEITECLLTSNGSASFRIRVLGDRSAHPVVNVFTPDAASLEQYLLWQEALELRHPNISSPISVGRLDWDGQSYPYVVLHKADENLAGVIQERALTPAESRELLRSVGAGLEYLHANGFVHSALSPEHVLAIGDSIRISSTSIRRINTPIEDGEPEASYKAPESAAENLTVASDVWCLGATLFEILSQKKCGEDCRELAKSLPDPFDWIVERCLEPEPHERPTLSEVFAILSGGVKRPEPPKPEPVEISVAAAAGASAAVATPAPAPTTPVTDQIPATPTLLPAPPTQIPATPTAKAATAAGPVPIAAASPSAIAAPAVRPPKPSTTYPPKGQGPAARKNGPTPVRPQESPRPKLTATPKPVYTENRPKIPLPLDEKPEESPRLKFISYAFLAVVLAGGLLWLVRPKPEPHHLGTGSSVTGSAAVATPAARTQTVPPESGSPAGTPPVPGSSAAVSQASGVQTAVPGGSAATDWRVVVFTFARKEDAEKQAQNLHAKHPGFDPQVFSPGANGPYLIVLGGPMNKDEANRMRQKARASGFPRDAYVQNFSR